MVPHSYRWLYLKSIDWSSGLFLDPCHVRRSICFLYIDLREFEIYPTVIDSSRGSLHLSSLALILVAAAAAVIFFRRFVSEFLIELASFCYVRVWNAFCEESFLWSKNWQLDQVRHSISESYPECVCIGGVSGNRGNVQRKGFTENNGGGARHHRRKADRNKISRIHERNGSISVSASQSVGRIPLLAARQLERFLRYESGRSSMALLKRTSPS